MTDQPWPDEATFQAPDSEQALMGALGHYPDAIAGVLADLPGTAFYGFARGSVWDTARKLSAEHQLLTPVTIARRMAADNAFTRAAQQVVNVEFSNASPASAAARHAELVADLAERRRLFWAVKRAASIVAKHPGDASDAFTAVRAEFEQPVTTETTGGPMSWPQLVEEFQNHQHPDTEETFIPTPWEDLDAILGGLFPGRVYVFGGRPGQGKSTAALNIAWNAAQLRHPTLVISKEMPTVDVTGRLVASAAGIELHDINNRNMTHGQRAHIGQFLTKAGNPTIHVDAKPRSLTGIKTLARGHHHRHGLQLLVVDYLQLVRADTPSRTREQEVAQVSRQLKELALELDLVVVLPAQLNRASTMRTDQRPTMADLRDSGQIEQDADAVILLHRPTEPERNGEIDFIIDKNRHGPTAVVTLAWRGGFGRIA